MSRLRSCLCAALLVLLASAVALAQRDLGTITGTVTDMQGAAVANAKVTITNDATGVASDTVTTDTGSFTRPALNPGTYTVRVEAAGFQRAEEKNILVSPNEPVEVNLTLQVGNVNQTVEVTAAAPLLQTESPIIGETLNTQQVTDLPLGGQRTFTFLARLTPGVQPAEPGARDALGGGFSANGVRSTGENNFLLNGVDNNVNVIDFINQTAFIIGPAPEAIGDMQIISNGADAQYGRAAGGILEISLKSGTNQLHGTLWEILSNTDFDANRWENNKSGLPRNKFNQNQFGAAAGGPIIKNKLFIFGDYQGTRIRTAGGSVQNLGFGPTFAIPTPAERMGDFSALLASGIVLYDPTSTKCISGCAPGSLSALPGQSPIYSRKPYMNNIIPMSELDPAALKLAALYPNPNTALANCGGAAPGSGCYAVATPGALNTDQGDGRVDWHYNDANSIFGTISWSNTYKSSVPPFPGALDGGNFNGSSEQDLGRNAMLSWTHTFSATMVNEARIGFSRLVTARTQANANTDEYKALGIGGYDPTVPLNGGAPQIDLGRYSQIGANNWLPTKEYNNEWDMIENLSIVHGNHTFKMGGEFRELHFPFFQVPYPHGEMSFGLTETGAQNPATGNLLAGTGDEFASFLLGSVDGTAQISTTNFISSTKQAYATYFMDNWKVTPKLTLNLGARYELFSPIGEQFGRQSNFDFANLTLYIPRGPNQNAPLPPNFNSPATINGVTFPALFTTPITVSRGQVSKYLIPWDKTDIGPRLGFAYTIQPKTVIRGFFGMFYGGEENQGGNPNRGESAPFNESPSLAPPSGVSSFQPDPLMANGKYTGALSVGFPVNVFNGFPVTSLQFREVYPDFRNPLVQEWNIAVQHEFGGQMALEVGYEGNHQARQLYQPDPNACPTLVNTNSSLNCNNFRPHPDIGSVSGTESFGIGNYDAMTASLTKRLSNGLQGQVSYTYGHALSDTGTTLSGSPGFFVLDGTKIGTSYSSAAWDIRHAVVGSFNYEIPFGRGKQYGANLNRVVQTLAGNWQINGILTLRTGQPFTLNSGGGACGGIVAEGFTAYSNGNCMPTLLPGVTNPNQAPPGGRSPNEWFNTANFVPISQLTLGQLETQGNTGLQSNVGPPQRTLDFSVFKDFDFTERWKLEFRAEGTNVANTPQYSVGCVSNQQNSGNFGQITCTNAGSERHIDFQLRLQF